VGWFKDGVSIPLKSEKYKITHTGSRHLLIIQNTQKADFGEYTCHANNSLGRADKVVRLSGEPSPARYTSGEELENGQKLMWVIESHSPITKYTLKYKNRKVLTKFCFKKCALKFDKISER
jgi:Immunoglobulin I-set domain